MWPSIAVVGIVLVLDDLFDRSAVDAERPELDLDEGHARHARQDTVRPSTCKLPTCRRHVTAVSPIARARPSPAVSDLTAGLLSSPRHVPHRSGDISGAGWGRRVGADGAADLFGSTHPRARLSPPRRRGRACGPEFSA